MNTYYDTTSPEFASATFDDIIVNGYGDRHRIIGETPNGRAWVTQSLKFDSVRSTVLKYDADRVAIVAVTA